MCQLMTLLTLGRTHRKYNTRFSTIVYSHIEHKGAHCYANMLLDALDTFMNSEEDGEKEDDQDGSQPDSIDERGMVEAAVAYIAW